VAFNLDDKTCQFEVKNDVNMTFNQGGEYNLTKLLTKELIYQQQKTF